ncbi:MAG: hypothetical protein D6706_21730 [Chloroflexi bacterium]|nr:MAG: hypothetical protein D6706_21730 [Chloroflexota bacterium]
MNNIHPSVLANMLRESMAKGMSPSLIVFSNSMSPLLRRGDQVWLTSINENELQPGDIVTVVAPEELLTHRFYGFRDNCLITGGDRSLGFDAPWPKEALLGKVVACQHNGRFLSLLIPPGRQLAQYLGWLAYHEKQWFSTPPTLITKFIHRLIWGWAWLLTTFVLAIRSFWPVPNKPNPTPEH